MCLNSAPPIPDFAKTKSQRGLYAKLSARTKLLILAAVDRGWFRTALRGHLVICGFPRAGSTLLHLMISTCVDAVHRFPKEKNALVAAQYPFRNCEFLVSKRPDDIFRYDLICQRYARSQADAYFLLSLRDPRDVLVSKHVSKPGEYYVSVSRWKAIYDHFRYVQEQPRVKIVRFEELINEPQKLQQEIAQHAGCSVIHPFEKFAEVVPQDFRTRALNGVRSPDPSAIGKWRLPEYTERIREILECLPELPEALIQLGYETDTKWIDALTASAETR